MLHLDADQPHIGASPAWGHMIGALSIGSPPAGRMDVADRIEARDLVSTCCWARDERRIDVLRDCLTEDAVWEGSVAGSVTLGPVVGRARLLDWMRDGWRLESGQCRHLALNTIFLVEEASRAVTVSSLLLTESLQDLFSARCSGFVRLDLVRSADRWRVSRAFVGWDSPPWRGRRDDLTRRERERYGLMEGRIDERHT